MDKVVRGQGFSGQHLHSFLQHLDCKSIKSCCPPYRYRRTGGHEWVTAAITIAGRRDYVRLTFTPIGSAVYGQDNVGQGLGEGENRMTIASHQPGLPSEATSRLLILCPICGAEWILRAG